MQKFSLLGLAFVAALLCLPTTSRAMPLIYNFEVMFDSGDLNGQTFNGSFSIDGTNFDRAGQEAFGPDSADKELLAFDITVAGTTFTMQDDDQFPEFPAITFNNGELFRINYTATGAIAFSIRDNIPGAVATYIGPDGERSDGSYSSGSFAVPEPGSIGIIALGLLGAGAVMRRR